MAVGYSLDLVSAQRVWPTIWPSGITGLWSTIGGRGESVRFEAPRSLSQIAETSAIPSPSPPPPSDRQLAQSVLLIHHPGLHYDGDLPCDEFQSPMNMFSGGLTHPRKSPVEGHIEGAPDIRHQTRPAAGVADAAAPTTSAVPPAVGAFASGEPPREAPRAPRKAPPAHEEVGPCPDWP